jgi:hypothetical protein
MVEIIVDSRPVRWVRIPCERVILRKRIVKKNRVVSENCVEEKYGLLA